MSALFSSSLFTFSFFLALGSVIVFLILKFDKHQRHKMHGILTQTKDVQPLFMSKSTGQKLDTLRKLCETDAKPSRVMISKQLDELVADYDKGNISLSVYCNRLNHLLAMAA